MRCPTSDLMVRYLMMKEEQKMSKLQCTGLGIHLKVRDINASRKFYEGTLGFVPVFGYGDDEFRASLPKGIPSALNDGLPGAPEKYRGVTYEPTPDAPFEIADGHIAVTDHSVFKDPISSPKISAMVRVKSLVPLIGQLGVRPSFPVRHYYWGTVEAVVRDPDGFVLVIIAPHSDGEVEKLREFVTVETISP